MSGAALSGKQLLLLRHAVATRAVAHVQCGITGWGPPVGTHRNRQLPCTPHAHTAKPHHVSPARSAVWPHLAGQVRLPGRAGAGAGDPQLRLGAEQHAGGQPGNLHWTTRQQCWQRAWSAISCLGVDSSGLEACWRQAPTTHPAKLAPVHMLQVESGGARGRGRGVRCLAHGTAPHQGQHSRHSTVGQV